MNDSTIAAIATPGGKGGIGIIKISGQKAIPIARQIFQPAKGALKYCRFESHRLHYGHIIDIDSNEIVDEVLLSVMKSPRSYTKEDVVEINAHSGHAVLKRILQIVLNTGARLAEPGEFTKRAFLNGRIDLTQAEGIIDTINAQTQRSLNIASSQIAGGLKHEVDQIQAHLIDLLTEAEAAIDFPDDVNDTFVAEDAVKRLSEKVLSGVESLIERYETGNPFREGIKMAVVGKPNVGKSSLMNRLIQKDRVIVTPFPGTTRDIIEDVLDIHGIPVTVTDTAGLHHTDDPIEAIGIQKTREYIENAALVLFMVDGSLPLDEKDHTIFNALNGKQAILVVNKVDLMKPDQDFAIPASWTIPDIKISALYGTGISTLKDLIAKETLGAGIVDNGSMIVPNLRHKTALETSLNAVQSAIKGLEEDLSVELVAIDIKEAADKLGEILGMNAKADLLDEIFSRFCIGK